MCQMTTNPSQEVNRESERLESLAEGFVADEPGLCLLHESVRSQIAPRLVWMMRQVGAALYKREDGSAESYEVTMYLTENPSEEVPTASMPKQILAVIGIKNPEETDYECVLATPEMWEEYLAKLNDRAA